MSETGTNNPWVQTVTVSRNGDQWSINPPTLVFEDWEWVEWSFEGLQPGEFPFISFAPPAPLFGPFSSLGPLGGQRILGKVHSGRDAKPPGGAYPYNAYILSEDSPVPCGSGEIVDRTTWPEQALTISVTYSEPDGSLEVSPGTVSLYEKGMATWVFKDLPQNTYPVFRFNPCSDPTLPAMPFLSLSMGLGEDGSIRAIAKGFAVNLQGQGAPSSFTYFIEIRDSAGNLLARHDPAIDNLGPPPPPDYGSAVRRRRA